MKHHRRSSRHGWRWKEGRSPGAERASCAVPKRDRAKDTAGAGPPHLHKQDQGGHVRSGTRLTDCVDGYMKKTPEECGTPIKAVKGCLFSQAGNTHQNSIVCHARFHAHQDGANVCGKEHHSSLHWSTSIYCKVCQGASKQEKRWWLRKAQQERTGRGRRTQHDRTILGPSKRLGCWRTGE